LPAADHHDLFAGSRLNRQFQRAGNFTPGRPERNVAGHDDILPPGQGPADGLPGLSAHDDRFTHGRFPEMPEFRRQVPGHAAIQANGAITGHGGDNRDCPAMEHAESQNRARPSRKALLMTDTELKLMAAAAIIGLSRIPNQG